MNIVIYNLTFTSAYRTRLQVTNLDQPGDKYVPYCHWTFPDDKFENNPDPSYMMAMKLNRKKKAKAKIKPVEDSFAIQVQIEYDLSSIPTSVVNPPPCSNSATIKSPKKSKKRKIHPEQPLTPKRPRTAYLRFLNGERERLKAKHLKISMIELTKVASQAWKIMPTETRAPFMAETEHCRKLYEKDMDVHRASMKEFKLKFPEWDLNQSDELSQKKSKTRLPYKNLFNKVVKLTKEGQRQAGTEFKYYFVLTYIPDLFWCHLAPLRNAGVYGKKKKKMEGRTKWMLVNEGEGKEMDITASACFVVKSRVVKGCADADKEEWDIIDPDEDQKQNGTKAMESTKISTSKTSKVEIRNKPHQPIMISSIEGTKTSESTKTSASTNSEVEINNKPHQPIVISSAVEASAIKIRSESCVSSESQILIAQQSDRFPEQISESDSDSPLTSDDAHTDDPADKTKSTDKVITPVALVKKFSQQPRSIFQTSLASFFKR